MPAYALSRILPLGLLCVGATSLGGCLPANRMPSRLAEPAAIRVMLVATGAEAGRASLGAALRTSLAERNLQLELLPTTPQGTAGTAGPDRDALWALLERGSAKGQHLLLLEANPSYFAQMDGRYRWTVPLQLRLGQAGSNTPPLDRSTAIPVFLRYDHQREAAALEASVPALRRFVARALDAYLGAALARNTKPDAAK